MHEQEAKLYNAILIASIVIGVIITYFFISIIRQQRKNLRLYRQSLLTEINTLEKERTRMAADLHDEVGPVLSAIKLRLSSLDIHNEADEEEVEKTNAQIDKLLRRMREITFDLMPNSLVRKGLAATLTEFIEYCSKSSPLTIRFLHEDLTLTQQQSINLYRIVQEIIHNAMKHAGATELKIELRMEKQMVVLLTKDNGVGFSYELRVNDAKGLGLGNLLSRTEIMGGKMFFESEKGKGTSYIFEIPTANNENNANKNSTGR